MLVDIKLRDVWQKAVIINADSVPVIDTTAGNTATINSLAGRFRKQNGSGTDFILINSFITSDSIILVTFASAPGATGYDGLIATAGDGQAIIYFKTASAAAVPANNTDVNFWVITAVTEEA